MLQFPFYVFLLVYLTIVFICTIVFYITYHHIHSTGTLKGGALATTLIMGALFILVIGATFASLSDISWSDPVSLGTSNWFEGITLFPQ